MISNRCTCCNLLSFFVAFCPNGARLVQDSSRQPRMIAVEGLCSHVSYISARNLDQFLIRQVCQDFRCSCTFTESQSKFATEFPSQDCVASDSYLERLVHLILHLVNLLFGARPFLET